MKKLVWLLIIFIALTSCSKKGAALKEEEIHSDGGGIKTELSSDEFFLQENAYSFLKYKLNIEESKVLSIEGKPDRIFSMSSMKDKTITKNYYYYNRNENNTILDYMYEFVNKRLDKTKITFKNADNIDIAEQLLKYYIAYYGSVILNEEIKNQ